MNEIVLNKKVSLERCIEHMETGLPFEVDYLKQDAIAMNLQRACELTIDIANHLIKSKKLGRPQYSRDSFALLQRAGLIPVEQMTELQAMVGFRNTLVRQYQQIDLAIVVDVIEHRLQGLLAFANLALEATD